MVEKKAEGGELKTVFLIFTSQKADMDGKQFNKFCKETKILDKKISGQVDPTFKTYCNKSTSKINYEGLQKILAAFAKIKGITYDNLVENIVSCGMLSAAGTKTDQ